MVVLEHATMTTALLGGPYAQGAPALKLIPKRFLGLHQWLSPMCAAKDMKELVSVVVFFFACGEEVSKSLADGVQADRCFVRTSSNRVLHAMLNFPNVKHPSTWVMCNKEKLCSLLTTINYTRDLQVPASKGIAAKKLDTNRSEVKPKPLAQTHIAGLVLAGDLYRLNAKLITEQPPWNLTAHREQQTHRSEME